MSSAIASCYYGIGFVATLWLALAWVGARLRGSRCSRAMLWGIGAAVLAVALVPFAGLSLWRWGLSIWPNPSVPLVGLAGLALWRHLGGRIMFSRADHRVAWIFGAVAGSALGLQTLSPVALDLYRWGWDGLVAVGAVSALAVFLFARGNRFGILLLAAILAWALGALETSNLWDYVVDPIYWLASLGAGLNAWREKRGTAPAAPAV
ncbi:MAG: hypothetical protein EXS43_14175 [Opitutus sp.]|nr:hypothetical protein [Opitutus sp.]